jgi:Na+-driven multidrug efflux pump
MQEIRVQARLVIPVAVGLIANYLLTVIALAFVGQLGTQELAAAALGSTLYSMSAKILLQGL